MSRALAVIPKHSIGYADQRAAKRLEERAALVYPGRPELQAKWLASVKALGPRWILSVPMSRPKARR